MSAGFGQAASITVPAGEQVDGPDVTITVVNAQNLAGNPVGTPNSATHVGGAKGPVISIQLSPATWTVGDQIHLEDVIPSSDPAFLLQNDGSLPEDMTISCSNGAGGWSLAAAPGTDLFSVAADINLLYDTFGIILTTGDAPFASNVPASAQNILAGAVVVLGEAGNTVNALCQVFRW